MSSELKLSSATQLLAALCIWREARNQIFSARLGVWWVIKNRAADLRNRWPKTVSEVILQPFQFSSFNKNDPNYFDFPDVRGIVWIKCFQVISDESQDPTNGAVFYFSAPITEPPKEWGEVEFCCKIDNLSFYK